MAEVKGKIVFCDYCGETIFRKLTGSVDFDGGWTHSDIFEAMPDGWGRITIPDFVPDIADRYPMLCPSCHTTWKAVLSECRKVVVEGFKDWKRAEAEQQSLYLDADAEDDGGRK